MRNLKLNWGPIGVSLAIIAGVNQVLLGGDLNYGQGHNYPQYPQYPQYGQGHNYPQYPHYPQYGQGHNYPQYPQYGQRRFFTRAQLIQLLHQLNPADRAIVVNLARTYPPNAGFRHYAYYGQPLSNGLLAWMIRELNPADFQAVINAVQGHNYPQYPHYPHYGQGHHYPQYPHYPHYGQGYHYPQYPQYPHYGQGHNG